VKFGDIKKNNFYFEIKHNTTDDFSQCLIINGIYIRNGGTAINYIMDRIVSKIREKLIKKFPGIKNGDIKNKLKILLVMRFFPNLKFTSQEKIEVSNSTKELSEFFGDIPFDKIVRQILKDEDIMLSITEYFKLKEEAKQNAELKKLAKTNKKRIVSDNYFPAQNKEILAIMEGFSALGGTQPVLGRRNIGYYVLKGKPLNVYNASVTKFKDNKELSELYKIILNEGYKKIVIISDADLDGISINSILFAFFYKYLPEYLKNNKIYRFNTPIAAEIKNKKLQKWVYTFDDIKKLNGNIKYFKGLGSWSQNQLEEVIKKDGFENMLMQFEFDEEDIEYIDKWLNEKRSDDRKIAIINNEFDIIKV